MDALRMQLKLELVVIPVADVDRAKSFSADTLGFGAITDVAGGVRYAGFQDPYGNGLLLQETAWRRGEAY